MVAFGVLFTAMYLLVGTLIRLYTLKFPDNRLSEALTFAH